MQPQFNDLLHVKGEFFASCSDDRTISQKTAGPSGPWGYEGLARGLWRSLLGNMGGGPFEKLQMILQFTQGLLGGCLCILGFVVREHGRLLTKEDTGWYRV